MNDMHDGMDASPIEEGVNRIAIEDEMQKSYIDYAMSVIVSRALPDVRDGLKPVHRRILYAMKEGGYDSSKAYRKSARIIGDVMGKYHPHGDQAIYDAMVRMVQPFSLRLPLIDGQGNFGSMDGDPPAAMRYTEARLAKSAETLLEDIDKETVAFQNNYDDSASEPQVLPARFPNMLVNGGGGIAVGMATNIPPHNLGEVLDACVAMLHNPKITLGELMEIIPAPDFPTGGIILGRNGVQSAFETGRGSVKMRAKTHIEEVRKDRDAIIVTEIPYQVNKARLIERIAEVVRDKVVEGISDIRDESDRDGVRVVIELKRDAMGEVVLNQLFRHTPLQTSFGVNMLALNKGMPEMLPLRRVLECFLEFRDEVIVNRTRYLLNKARERVHLLVGLLVSIGNIDPVIELIRKAPDPATARENLMNTAWPAGDAVGYIDLIGERENGNLSDDGLYHLSEAQARAILELRLQRLTGMERNKIESETEELAAKITEYLNILSSQSRRRDVIIEEMQEIKEKFATPRRTVIEESEYEHDIEDLIQKEDMVVTVTHGGYVKRVPLNTYRAQRRGGKGRSGMSTKEDDFVWQVFVANTHTPILFFTSKGMVYTKKVYLLPEGSPQSRGKAFVNLLPIESDEKITAVMPLPENEDEWENLYAVFATSLGNIRRNKLSDFTNVKANGKIAMKLSDGDHLVSVLVCDEGQDVFLATEKGVAMRFPVSRKNEAGSEQGVRVFVGRNSTGVRGIRLQKNDKVISMTLLKHNDDDSETRRQYLQIANAKRRLLDEKYANSKSDDALRDIQRVQEMDEEKFLQMQQDEGHILTIAENGMGQLCSTHDYRVTSRGGKGINNMDTKENIVASYLVSPDEDELMLITDAGQIIRIPVKGVRQISRNSKGVKLFDIADKQKIVSCARVQASKDEANDVDEEAASDDITPPPSDEGQD